MERTKRCPSDLLATRFFAATHPANAQSSTFLKHVGVYYRRPDGSATSEVSEFAYSLRPVNHLFGMLAVDDFGPLRLKEVRELMVRCYRHPKYGEQVALCRSLINKRVRRIVAAFKWGVSEERVAAPTWHALKRKNQVADGPSSRQG